MEQIMRTTLNLDQDVIEQVMQLTGLKNKSQAVNRVLESFVYRQKKQNILKMKGKLDLENNWNELREMEINET